MQGGARSGRFAFVFQGNGANLLAFFPAMVIDFSCGNHFRRKLTFFFFCHANFMKRFSILRSPNAFFAKPALFLSLVGRGDVITFLEVAMCKCIVWSFQLSIFSNHGTHRCHRVLRVTYIDYKKKRFRWVMWHLPFVNNCKTRRNYCVFMTVTTATNTQQTRLSTKSEWSKNKKCNRPYSHQWGSTPGIFLI